MAAFLALAFLVTQAVALIAAPRIGRRRPAPAAAHPAYVHPAYARPAHQIGA